jgi:spore germination cell wall hydrolase CwlJ-like protein
MSKVLIGVTCTALVAVLGVQQYQLASIAEDVAEIKQSFTTQTTDQLAYTVKDEACLAKNIYYEAGIESEQGKYAVGQVTVNRLKSGRWGNDLCSVVYAKSQFSWTLKKKLEKPRGQAWMDSQWVAHRVLNGERVAQLDKAMFYHAEYVFPRWRDPVAKIQQIGTHIFYTKAKMKVTNI